MYVYSLSVKCAGHMLNKFYDNPTAEPDLGCVNSMEEPQIYAPLYVTNIGPRLIGVYAEDKEKLALPAAWTPSHRYAAGFPSDLRSRAGIEQLYADVGPGAVLTG